MKIVVAICTRNPRISTFKKVLSALEFQTFKDFETLVVDNGSEIPISEDYFNFHDFKLIFEPRVGNSWARFTAIKEFDGDLLIFVDDDNVLESDYIEKAREIAIQKVDWGAFGGRQFKSRDLKVARYLEPFLPYLAIRDLGELEIAQSADLNWGEVEPVGAGMCLRREVTDSFLNHPNLPKYFHLGRSGKKFLSGEDSFIARQCFYLGLKFGYSPDLKLTHDINPNRLRILYLSRLMFGYGVSDHLMELALNIRPHALPGNLKKTIKDCLFLAKSSKLGPLFSFRILGYLWARRVRRASH